jgi:plasmid stability protein
MPELVIPDVDETLLRHLREQASAHGHTAEEEARLILAQAVRGRSQGVWAQVNDFRERLAATGRDFSDSADLLHEDRGR